VSRFALAVISFNPVVFIQFIFIDVETLNIISKSRLLAQTENFAASSDE
jgi:hypothetical protein